MLYLKNEDIASCNQLLQFLEHVLVAEAFGFGCASCGTIYFNASLRAAEASEWHVLNASHTLEHGLMFPFSRFMHACTAVYSARHLLDVLLLMAESWSSGLSGLHFSHIGAIIKPQHRKRQGICLDLGFDRWREVIWVCCVRPGTRVAVFQVY